MSDSLLLILLLVAAIAIIAPLAFYAGKLLYQLKQQKQRQHQVREKRIEIMTESIQTIAMAIEQQQCNLSEGAIRLTNLLDALPLEELPDWRNKLPALYELYEQVRHLPTHDARKALSRSERQEQDKHREEHEARLEHHILKEVVILRELRF